jgi:hypothetical protein
MRLPVGRGRLESGKRGLAPRDHVNLLLQRELEDPSGRVVDQRIRRLEMRTQATREFWSEQAVDACQQLDSRLRADRLLEERVQAFVGHVVEARRGLAHLAHTGAECGAVLRVKPEVEAERALDLPLWCTRQMGCGDLDEPALDVVVSPKQRDVLLDGQPGTKGLLVAADAGERWNRRWCEARSHAASLTEQPVSEPNICLSKTSTDRLL